MIHRSHDMQLDNGTSYAAFPGQWFGTWRCKKCRAKRVRYTDSDWISAEAKAACSTGNHDQ
jgi:hypothetical protein